MVTDPLCSLLFTSQERCIESFKIAQVLPQNYIEDKIRDKTILFFTNHCESTTRMKIQHTIYILMFVHDNIGIVLCLIYITLLYNRQRDNLENLPVNLQC
jgi:hypothetical protein